MPAPDSALPNSTSMPAFFAASVSFWAATSSVGKSLLLAKISDGLSSNDALYSFSSLRKLLKSSTGPFC